MFWSKWAKLSSLCYKALVKVIRAFLCYKVLVKVNKAFFFVLQSFGQSDQSFFLLHSFGQSEQGILPCATKLCSKWAELPCATKLWSKWAKHSSLCYKALVKVSKAFFLIRLCCSALVKVSKALSMCWSALVRVSRALFQCSNPSFKVNQALSLWCSVCCSSGQKEQNVVRVLLCREGGVGGGGAKLCSRSAKCNAFFREQSFQIICCGAFSSFEQSFKPLLQWFWGFGPRKAKFWICEYIPLSLTLSLSLTHTHTHTHTHTKHTPKSTRIRASRTSTSNLGQYVHPVATHQHKLTISSLD